MPIDIDTLNGPQRAKILHLKQRTVFYGAPAEYEESPEGREFLGGGRT